MSESVATATAPAADEDVRSCIGQATLPFTSRSRSPAQFNVLVLGAIGNVVAGFASVSTGTAVFGFLIGIVPGVIFVGSAALTAFATGLLIGGCLVGLIGEICGASMVGFSVR